ncbi:MAG TPA: amidohydrolase [Methyloceanibacter sp.]|nr:amidohydrolase [Methyloceanibacter sp.]
MSAGRSISRRLIWVSLAVMVSGLWSAVEAAEDGKADVVLRNGKIYTADKARSIRQAIAFTGNTIVAVGDDKDMAPLIGSGTKVIDLGGKLVLPGMIDTHIHPIIGALNGAKCSLAGVKATIEALKPVIRDCLDRDQGGTDDWFEAVQLDNYGFSATAKDLDTIGTKRPVALWGNDGHTAWVNSRGLALLGVTAATQDPPGGKIARDATGAPLGSFADSAAIFVSEKIPEPPLEERAALTSAELKKMSAYGITSLMDAFVARAEAAVWRRLYDTGKLPMRVRMAIYVASPSDDSDEAVAGLIVASKAGDVDSNVLRSGVVKVFADGVMEYPAQTAALLSPYLDADGKLTKHAGELYFDPERFARLVQKLDAAGLTVHVHAIGDRAVRASLDAFASARAANGDRDNRHQIAHLQLVDPADLPRFKELGVIADFQLEWARREPATEGPLEPYLGPERYRYLYPAGSLHQAGATIIGGSDWDISSYNPFRAFQTAVTRAGGAGQPPLNIDERIPLQTAIDAYTINAAYAMKQDTTTGSLEVGKRADLAVLDRDILTIDPETIQETQVLATYLDGRLVHSAPPGNAGDDDEDEEPGKWWDEREARMRDWLHRD